jgi:hypothetical protein
MPADPAPAPVAVSARIRRLLRRELIALRVVMDTAIMTMVVMDTVMVITLQELGGLAPAGMKLDLSSTTWENY